MRLAEIAGYLVGRRACLGCGRSGMLLCELCAHAVEPSAVIERLPVTGTQTIRVVVACDYSGPARQSVLELKMAGRLEAATALGTILHRTLMRAGTTAEVVTWVPGRRADRSRRGFDHAQVLAGDLARRLGLPLLATLRGASGRADQAGLDAAARAINAAGSFSVLTEASVAGAEILLVDDLLTTGATARACSKALLAAGARGVEVAVACRASEPAKAVFPGTRHT